VKKKNKGKSALNKKFGMKLFKKENNRELILKSF